MPLIFSFGAALEDLPLQDFVRDPTKISNALRTIQNYFQADGVVCYGDKTVVAESLGCTIDYGTFPPTVQPLPEIPRLLDSEIAELQHKPRVETALEVTRRLGVLLPDLILVGMTAGPLTLARQLTGLAIPELMSQLDLLGITSKAILTFVKALGDAGIDLLVISEDSLPPLDEQTVNLVARFYSPLRNTAKFYDLPFLLKVEEFLPEYADPLRKIVDGLIFPADAPSESWQKFKRTSFALPVSILEKERGEIDAYLAGTSVFDALRSSRLLLVTTENEVAGNLNKELMIRGIQTIRDFLRNQAVA